MADLEQILSLVEQTSARLCHDLGGLIGTVGNALDMAHDDAGAESEVLAFAASATRALRERLRLMRAAWGPDSAGLTLPALRHLTESPLNLRRIALDTHALDPDVDFPPATARLLLNVILLAADGLPKGGAIMIIGGSTDLIVRIDGPDGRWPAGLSLALRDEQTAFDTLRAARSPQLPLTALLALGRGIRLSPVLGAQGIEALRMEVG